MITAVICINDGFEEVETLGPLDVLRRAGITVTLAGEMKTVTGGKGAVLTADATIDSVKDTLYDILLIPGGPGWKTMQKNETVKAMTAAHIKANKFVCAICAASATCLGHWGFLNGKKATCYPNMQTMGLQNAHFCEDRVVVDGKFITSRGPGTALEFALKIVECAVSKEKSKEIASAMLVKQ